jgi:hypothetical protein
MVVLHHTTQYQNDSFRSLSKPWCFRQQGVRLGGLRLLKRLKPLCCWCCGAKA